MNNSEIINELTGNVTVVDIVIFLPGLILLLIWLIRTGFGRRSLNDSVPRRNNMPGFAPFIPIAFWICGLTVSYAILEWFFPGLTEFKRTWLENFLGSICVLLSAASVILLARVCFVRGLKGFGLDSGTVRKDIIWAVLNLISILPVIMLTIGIVILFGKAFVGEDFQLQQHEGLEILLRYPQLSLRILLIIFVTVIAPIFEELLFRGLIQTTFRGFLKGPWSAVIVTSAIFAVIHPDWMHWPVLFILGMVLGYSYEKSGSLLRPIFIHALFNAVSVTTTLLTNMI